ncbi:MAG: hypothetical protein ACOC0N_11510 [Chroococcales cyanobacterium]
MRFPHWSALSLGILLTLAVNPANALPGQRTDKVAAWMNAHPTLRPDVLNSLSVQRTNTAAQRFSFEASVLPPGQVTFPKDRGTVRSENFHFFDMINGVTFDRLQESLRVIYGPEIYQDFDRAQIVYDYPTQATIDLARRQNRPLLASTKGQLRLGQRYGYWMEVVETDSGKAYNGYMTVFLKEDLDKVEAELRDR